MRKLILISATCAAVTACGGGGGDGGTTSGNASVGPAVPLTGANYEPATKEVVGTVVGIQSSSGGSVFTGAQINDSIASPGLLLQSKLPQVIKLMKQNARLTGAAVQETEACDGGGSFSIVGNDHNDNNEFDTGDTATISYNNCTFDAITTTGNMSFRVKSGRAFDNSGDADLSVTIEGLSTKSSDVSTLTNGSFDMKISTVSSGVTNIYMETPLMTSQTTQGGTTKVYQYKNYIVDTSSSAYSTSWSVNGNISVPTLGANTATVKTTERFVFPASEPTSQIATAGKLEITFKQGGKIRVTAVPATFIANVEADVNGDGTFEESKSIHWVDLL